MMFDQWVAICERREAEKSALEAIGPPVDKFGDGKVMIVANAIAQVKVTDDLQVVLFDHGEDRYSVEYDRAGAMTQVTEMQAAIAYCFDVDWDVPNNMILMDEQSFMMLKLALG